MSIKIRVAKEEEFEAIRSFYWEVIDLLQNRDDSVGWKKGIYPDDIFIKSSLAQGELYVLGNGSEYYAAVILNSSWNDGYEGLEWNIECNPQEVIVPHALAVHPKMHGRGIGKAIVNDIIEIANRLNKKAIRLDVLGGNIAAEKLYSECGFKCVGTKNMYYEDTGWADFKMFEMPLA